MKCRVVPAAAQRVREETVLQQIAPVIEGQWLQLAQGLQVGMAPRLFEEWGGDPQLGQLQGARNHGHAQDFAFGLPAGVDAALDAIHALDSGNLRGRGILVP